MKRGRMVVCGASLLLLASVAGPVAFGQSTPSRTKPGDSPGTFRFAEVDETALGLWEGDRPILVYN